MSGVRPGKSLDPQGAARLRSIRRRLLRSAASNPHKVDITTTVTSDDGKVVFKSEDARESTELQGKSGGYGYGARVPLAGLPPGLYVLKIHGKSRVGDGSAVERQVQFRIAEAVASSER